MNQKVRRYGVLFGLTLAVGACAGGAETAPPPEADTATSGDTAVTDSDTSTELGTASCESTKEECMAQCPGNEGGAPSEVSGEGYNDKVACDMACEKAFQECEAG